MPCNDVTELIELSLNAQDRLSAYRLTKRTCGAEVGPASLLADWLLGDRVETILELDSEALARQFGDRFEQDGFLYAKHLVALQQALSVLTGRAAGGPADGCAVAKIIADEDQTHFVGTIAVHLLTDRIEACGGCATRPRV